MNLLSPAAAVSFVSGSVESPHSPPEAIEAAGSRGSALLGQTDAARLHPVATEVGGWAARLARWVRIRLSRNDPPRMEDDLAHSDRLTGDAIATAVGALEGTLKGKSLEGALKEAQILEAYASARQKNADAEKLEAEAAKLRMETEKLRQEILLDGLECLLRAQARVADSPAVVDPKTSDESDPLSH